MNIKELKNKITVLLVEKVDNFYTGNRLITEYKEVNFIANCRNPKFEILAVDEESLKFFLSVKTAKKYKWDNMSLELKEVLYNGKLHLILRSNEDNKWINFHICFLSHTSYVGCFFLASELEKVQAFNRPVIEKMSIVETSREEFQLLNKFGMIDDMSKEIYEKKLNENEKEVFKEIHI
jgi:hypothetical protein